MASSESVVGFVGLDDVSLELAASLVHSGYAVQAFDSQFDGPLMVEFSKTLGGIRCASAMDATRGVVAIILLISQPAQLDDLIFGREGILEGLKKNAVVVLRSVMVPAEVQRLEKQLTGKGFQSNIS